VRLTVLHNGSTRDFQVVLGELPGKQEEPQEAESDDQSQDSLEGLAVDNLMPGVARQLGVPASTKGVVVTDVDTGSAAADAGVQRGDIILEVNRKPIASAGDFKRAIASSGGATLLLISRGGTTLYVVLR
jgi:serine protease Do